MKNIKILNVFPSCEYGGTEKVIAQTSKYLLDEKNFNVGLCTVEGSKLKEFRDLGVEVFLIDGFNQKSYLAKTINSLFRSIETFKPNIIHTHSLYSLILISCLLKVKGLNIPLVHTGHGGPKRYYEFYASILTSLVNKFIVISKPSFESLIKYRKNIQNAILIENGIDEFTQDEEYIEDSTKIGGETLNICYIGRLSKQKGLITLLEALKMLNDKKVKFHLRIIGNGELKSDLKSEVDEKGIKEYVEFIDATPRPWSLVKEFPIVVMPSLWEPGGIVAMEAIARNHTIIASNVGGLSELINNKKNGYLFESGNSHELEKILLDLHQKKRKYIAVPKEEKEKYLFKNGTGIKIKNLYLELVNK